MNSLAVHDKSICEILAPAGSFACMKAAFYAGADAVYAGGGMFGARASAVNFSETELMAAIDYAHLHNRKFYLTVNTLLKEAELQNALYDYLAPLYQKGLDAVIVQDFGVLSFVRRNFPDIPIHASTQMNITGPYFAKALQKFGVSRVVTARELSLEEINTIYEHTHMEIESFVHGALCYCHSGQCLLSSMIGGRSGNRGRCAQPCRLPYDALASGKKILSHDGSYLLSPKDLCTLKLLPDILEAGVYSLKIEGRMKKPEYVASVTAMYRKYVNQYLEHGREGYQVEEEDIRKLMDIYNRGGFTDGYYKRHNGKDMMALQRPNHCGVAIGKLISIGKNTLEMETDLPLRKGDVLEFDTKSQSPDYTLGQDLDAGQRFTIKNRFQNGRMLYEKELLSRQVSRIRNQSLITELTNQYLDKDLKVPITGNVKLEIGKPVRMSLSCGDVSIICDGAEVSQAKNRPMTAEEIKEKLEKTGGTDFTITSFTVDCEDNIFIPVGMLNELRRTAFSQLKAALLRPYARTCEESTTVLPEQNDRQQPEQNNETKIPEVSVLVSTKEQFFACCHFPTVHQIIIEKELFDLPQLQEMITLGCQNGKQMFLAMPYIFRGHAYEEWMEERTLWDSEMVSGFLIRNLEEYFYLTAEEQKFPFRNKMLLFDEGLYCTNSEAGAFLNSLQPKRITYPAELKLSELTNLALENGELVVYGYPAVMVSAGCIKKTLGCCDHKTTVGTYELQNRTKEHMKVMNICSQCYNVIYFQRPVHFSDEGENIKKIHPAALRMHFTFEDAHRTEEILNQFTQTLLPVCRNLGRGDY